MGSNRADRHREKLRRYRARQLAGRIVVQVECDGVGLAEALIHAGFLKPADYDDRVALRRALEHVVGLWCGVTGIGTDPAGAVK